MGQCVYVCEIFVVYGFIQQQIENKNEKCSCATNTALTIAIATTTTTTITVYIVGYNPVNNFISKNIF